MNKRIAKKLLRADAARLMADMRDDAWRRYYRLILKFVRL